MINLDIKKKLHGAGGDFEFALNTEIEDHSMVSISGVSGSGKTTLLRMIAGLTEPDSGSIKVDADIWYEKKSGINKKPQDRKIGFVFQEYSLFPNMTVCENLEYAGADKRAAHELLGLVELENLAGSYPCTLSGGQKQRITLARAIARNPKILLLDEPFSTLDHEMKIKLQDEIVKIHKRYNITTILVSHDIAEMYKLSSRIISIDKGRIVQDGSPQDILTNRQTSNKFSFTGEIVDIRKADIVYNVIIAAGNTISEVVLSKEDVKDLHSGDKVMAAAKAFQPIVKKIK
jgi:molybdate transport system ATP-binding protein